jgi:hypothetical protein
MRVMLGVALLALLCATASFAGTVIFNDTGEVAYGLRMVFSKGVTITEFSDDFSRQTPLTAAKEFVFSGGALESWGSLWLNWEPTDVMLVQAIWIATPLGDLTQTQIEYTFDGAPVSIPCWFGVAPVASGIDASDWLEPLPAVTRYDSWYQIHGWGFPPECCVDLSTLDDAGIRAYALDTYRYELFIGGVKQLPTGVYVYQDGVNTWQARPDNEGTDGATITCDRWWVVWLFEYAPGDIPVGEHWQYGEYNCLFHEGTLPDGQPCNGCRRASLGCDVQTESGCMVYGEKLLVVDP